MKTENIKAIFTNLLFVIGVILIIFGFVNGVSTLTKSFIFEKYPLDTYEETKCESEFAMQATSVGPDGKALPPQESPEARKDRLNKCKESLEMARKVKQTEDIVSSITTCLLYTSRCV